MIDVAFAIPGDIEAATGGYAYARKVLRLLPDFGVNGHHIALPGSFPNPAAEDLELTRRLLDQLLPTTPILFDGLAFGALPVETLDGLRSPIVALVHHPLALETGLDDERRRQLRDSERASLARASAVIATSPLTARTLTAEYGVEPVRLTVAEPGTEPAIRARGTGRPFTILAVGSLIPRKGYRHLIEALAMLGRTDWHLTIVGSPAHDPAEANRIREMVLASGRRGRINIAGAVSARELQRLYTHADLFVMPSLYEGYGMVLAEAMARGLAIVSTTGGAAAETVPDDAAIKVQPGDSQALAEAIVALIDDPARLGRMRDASWSAGLALPRWRRTAEIIAGVLKAQHKELTT